MSENFVFGQDQIHISFAQEGPRGPAGPEGGAGVQKVADIPLGGGRVVKSTSAGGVTYASAMVRGDSQLARGVTQGAASAGAPVTILALGEMTDSSWTWVPGLPIYVGVDGALTQTTSPTWAFQRIVAMAISATTINISFQPPIIPA